MNIEEFLRSVTALPGVTGSERPAAEYIADAFRPYCDEVHITPLNCVVCHRKGKGQKVIVCAHLDEIGMMVSRIEEDGSLRMQSVGGVDPRILPGMRVRVYGKKLLCGVVGAKAPHLLTEKEKNVNYTFADTLYVDMGMPADKVRKMVSVGDRVCFEARYVTLKNDRVATKTADDRACVGVMLEAARLLSDMRCDADVYFVATCQEEIGSYGAAMSGYSVDPDYAVALDVCHAETPGAPPLRVHKLDSLVASKGPFIHPFLRSELDRVAKEQGIALQSGVGGGSTSTDADSLTIARGGIPTVLLELPLKYMHTNGDPFDMHALTEGGRLLAHYLRAVDPSWEEKLWN